MTETEALARMVSPGMRRPQVYPPRGGVMQIHIIRSCDKACFSCTQGSNLAGKAYAMNPEQFEVACRSLEGYFGVVGIFGGNPAVNKHFDEICKILRAYFPKEQCGLWCNKLFGHGKAARATFNPAVSNLNVHLDREAYDEFRRDWPESIPFGLDKDSRHASCWTAMKDMQDYLPFPDGRQLPNTEENRWELISGCDINHNWSAMIGLFRGHVRCWFCEIAGSQSINRQEETDYPDTGLPAVPGWWRQGMSAFAHQARKHCHECGIPLRGYGELAVEGTTEQVSETYRHMYKPKVKDREVQLVQLSAALGPKALGCATHYVQNSKL